MPFAIDKILISLGFILLFTLFIGKHAALAIDVAYPDRFPQSNEDRNVADLIRYMAKRRFLPTRNGLQRFSNDDYSSENDEDSHLNTKRYFLKSKRYFLNSKRDDE